MPIACALFENNITADPDDYAAMVQVGWPSRPPARADGDDLVQDIIDQGSTVNKRDILAVTAALKPLPNPIEYRDVALDINDVIAACRRNLTRRQHETA